MQQVKPRVLIVDDEATSVELFQHLLGEQFEFSHVARGEAALDAALAGHPAVILMDIEMPGGIDGYQACRMIKDDPAVQQVPVIFMSAHTETEDRLKAYASGGDDYVSKPVSHHELRHKLSLALANQRRRLELAEKVRVAASLAMTSMREAADAGAVLQFQSLIFRQSNPDDIASSVLQTLHGFRIRGAVQLREGIHHVSRNSDGSCSPVEVAVLTAMAAERRIVDIGARSAFNYERATIIVYDMPLDDPALYGRLKDTVVKMAEALDSHLRTLHVVNAIQGQNGRLRARIAQGANASNEALARLDALAMAQQQAITDPALPDGLKEALQQMLIQGSRVRQSIEGLSRDLEDALRNEAPVVMPASAAPVSNTELF